MIYLCYLIQYQIQLIDLSILANFLIRLDQFYRAKDMKCESQERKEETLGEILEILPDPI